MSQAPSPHQFASRHGRRIGRGIPGVLAAPILLALPLVLVLLTLLLAPVTARADERLCAPGHEAGQCESPQGVAVDPANGLVYLADSENQRVDVFDSTGAFTFAFGWEVNATTPEEKLQKCTAETGCQAGSSGSGPGQFKRFGAGSIAVDPSSHDVYVVDNENNRVQKFDSSGNFLLAFGSGVNSGTSGQPDICTNAGPPANVCGSGSRTKPGQIPEPGQFEEFPGGSRVAVGPGGVVYVLGDVNRLRKFTSTGAYISTVALSPAGLGRNVNGFAVEPSGGFYTASARDTGAVRKYDAAGNLLNTFNPSLNINELVLDPADNIFVTDFINGVWTIFQYDASGAKTRVIAPESLETTPRGIAYYHSPSGDLFLTETKGLLRIAFPPPGPVLIPNSAQVDLLGSVRATLKIRFNPQGKASTARFQYVDKGSFDTEGGFDSPNTQTTPESEPTPATFDNQTASATNVCIVPTEPSCLEPATTYYFRAIAKNDDGEVKGDKASFTTKPSHEILAAWVSDAGTDTVRLHAEVNPLGIHTTGHFQYIAEGADYQANGFANALEAPSVASPLDFGSGEAPVARATQLGSLQPGTTYHYRFLATDPFFPPAISAEQTFTTFAAPDGGEGGGCSNQAFRTGPGAALPDCRAYEIVTPPGRSDGDVVTRINLTGFPTNLDQSSIDGNGLAYTSYGAFADPQSAPFTSQYLASRHDRGEAGEGWSTESIAPARTGHFRFELENEYQAFLPDLSSGWLLQEGEPTLDPCAPVGFAGLYRRESASGAYAALSCSPPSELAKELNPTALATQYMPELQGFSADGSKALIRIDDKLTADASSATAGESPARPIYQSYLSTGGGQLRLVSVLPNGEAADVDSSAGTARIEVDANHNRFNSVLHAISDDGRRVFWTAGFETETGPAGPLYLRINADQEQSNIREGKCNQPTRACTLAVSGTVTPTPEHAFFQTANPQGTRALFTVSSGPLAGNLYRFDAEAKPPASELIGEKVVDNILGASEDLSRVYFSSTKASAQAQSEGAIPGHPNVYLEEGGATRYVVTLSTPETAGFYADTQPNVYGKPMEKTPIFRTARVSPDGQSLVFMSNSPELAERTAGYDNTDLANGQKVAEVYLYDAEAGGGAGALRCVSCNPSGARPSGRRIREGLDGHAGPFGAATIPLFQSQLYQPRYLSDDGNRVFFDSFESLVLGDTNGAQDVYQWQAVGSGDCTSQSSFYVTRAEGCLNLISSGKSPEDSRFLDASPSGSDVFFATVESLLGQDRGLIDVYDARVGGGFPPPTQPPAACEGEACQAPPDAPDDPIPASSTFAGAGNVKANKHKPGCRKGSVRRKGRCVKKQSGKKAHAKRGKNQRRAAR